MLAEVDMENPGGALQPGMYLSVEITPRSTESAASPAETAPSKATVRPAGSANAALRQ